MQRDEALSKLKAFEMYGKLYDSDLDAVLWALKHIAELEASIAEKDAALDRIATLLLKLSAAEQRAKDKTALFKQQIAAKDAALRDVWFQLERVRIHFFEGTPEITLEHIKAIGEKAINATKEGRAK